MMEKELEQLVKVAWKAARCGNLEHKCVNALSKIRSLPLSMEAIATTHAGKHIASLCTHPRSNIKDLASLILTNWRRKLYNQGRKSAQNPKPAKPVEIPKPAKPVEIPKPAKSLKLRIPKTVKVPNKTCLKADHDQRPPIRGDNMPNCDNPMRNKIREQVFQALCVVLGEVKGERSQLNSCDPVGVAASVESALFLNWGLSSNGSCRNKYLSLLCNLKDPKNSDFRRKILFGDIKPEEVTKLSAQEMASDGRQHENQMMKARALKKCIVGTQIC